MQTRAGRLLENSGYTDYSRQDTESTRSDTDDKPEKKKRHIGLKLAGLSALVGGAFAGGVHAHSKKDDIRKGIIKQVNKAFDAKDDAAEGGH